MEIKRHILGALCGTAILAGVTLVVGCGRMTAPLAPGRAASVQQVDPSALSEETPFVLAFSPKAFEPRARATKPTSAKSAKGVFSPRKSGELAVDFNRRSSASGVGVDRATFEVKKGSLGREAAISMTAFSGSTLADIAVLFTPSGLDFNPPATLTLVIKGDLSEADLKALKAFHKSGNEIDEVSVRVNRSGRDEWTVVLKVPGFSSYSLGDEWFPPEAGP